MTAQQLKNSILQMAVQGKLVPQDPNDEPASVLLERIRAEKEQLIKQKKIKREKNPSIIFKGADNTPYEKIGNGEPVSLADEVPFDIPDTWEWVRLCHLGCFSSGKTPSMSDKSLWGTDTMWVTSKDMKSEIISSSEIMLSEKGAAGLKKYPAGTLLMVARSGILRRLLPICTLGVESAINQDIKAFELFDTSLSELIFYFLKGQETEILRDYVKSVTTVESLKFDEFQNMLFPLPPKEEQTRILNKIHELRPLWEAYEKAENERISQNEEFPARLRKSIIQQAVQGKLVPQNPADEPAYNLLERIRKEKEQLVKSGKIKKDKHESVIFRRDNSHYEKRGSIVECIDNIIPFDIPDSWEWVRLDTIITSTDAGKSPQCDNRPRKDDEWGVIKTTAIQDGYFVPEENKVLPHGFVVNVAIAVHNGDLLITRAGPRNRTGVVCVVEGEPANLILSDKTVRLSYVRGFVNPLFIMTALNSPAVQSFVIEAMSGMAASQVNISQEKMKTFLLPLPPLNEQQRIVDAVASLYEQISRLIF